MQLINSAECGLRSFGGRSIVCDVFAEVWAKMSDDWLMLVRQENVADVITVTMYSIKHKKNETLSLCLCLCMCLCSGKTVKPGYHYDISQTQALA